MENKICTQCENEFHISKDELSFYEKIKVPTPRFCVDCRLKQRLIWRNEKTLYRRTCDLCKKNIISIYSPDSPFTVYCRECFHSDNWDPSSFASKIDFSKPFLRQFRELQLKVPRIASFVFQNTQSEYVNGAAFNKNCYMAFVSDHNEDLLYSYSTMNSRTSSDLLNCNECELCYECLTCSKCYQVTYSEDCSSSQNLMFCRNCVNCQDCIGCVNLKNKRYAIFNEIYSKEDYLEKVAELNLHSREGVAAVKEKVAELFLDYPVKYYHGLRNVHVTGDYILNSKNSFNVFNSNELEDCQYINHGHQVKDSSDAYVLVDKSERAYQIVSGIAISNVQSGNCIWHGYDIAYSDTCENSHHLLGCVGLRKREYCILNRQYSKEEYEQLALEVLKHMSEIPYADEAGRQYMPGDFFPFEFSPFAYNETVIQEYFPITESNARQAGFSWKNAEEKKYSPTLFTQDLSRAIDDVSDEIMKEVIACAHGQSCTHGCTQAFKITQSELELYRRLKLPIPTLCFNCRHGERNAKINPRKLYKRITVDGAEVETTYAPDRKEKILSETGYQRVVE